MPFGRAASPSRAYTKPCWTNKALNLIVYSAKSFDLASFSTSNLVVAIVEVGVMGSIPTDGATWKDSHQEDNSHKHNKKKVSICKQIYLKIGRENETKHI